MTPVPYLVFDVGGGRGHPQPLQLQALCDEHCQAGRVALVHNVVHQVAGKLEVVDLEGEGVVSAVHWSGLHSFTHKITHSYIQSQNKTNIPSVTKSLAGWLAGWLVH